MLKFLTRKEYKLNIKSFSNYSNPINNAIRLNRYKVLKLIFDNIANEENSIE